MALRPLVPLKGLNGLETFIQHRELDTFFYFSQLWSSIFEYLLLCNYPNTALKFFIESLSFFKTRSVQLLKRHQTCISAFQTSLLSNNTAEIKKILRSESIFRLFEDMSGLLGKFKTHTARSLKKILDYTQIQVVEIVLGCSKLVTGSQTPIFQVFLALVKQKVWFLHLNRRLELRLPEFQIYSKEEELLEPVQENVFVEQAYVEESLEPDQPTNEDFYLKKKVKNSALDLKSFCPTETLFSDACCGSGLCLNCSKKVKRTSQFIINPKCCFFYIFTADSTQSEQLKIVDTEENCVFCDKPAVKREKILCVCCFLDKVVYKGMLKFGGCPAGEKGVWVDTSVGNESVRCGFCGAERNEKFICSVCDRCGDLVCLGCLRRNPFIVEGLCGNCNVKRLVWFKNI